MDITEEGAAGVMEKREPRTPGGQNPLKQLSKARLNSQRLKQQPQSLDSSAPGSLHL